MKSTYNLEHIKKQLLPRLLKHKNSYHFRDPVNVDIKVCFLYVFSQNVIHVDKML